MGLLDHQDIQVEFRWNSGRIQAPRSAAMKYFSGAKMIIRTKNKNYLVGKHQSKRCLKYDKEMFRNVPQQVPFKGLSEERWLTSNSNN